ncbi:hypothetical protein NDS46_23200 [Paenibacillus thiaminolyticus]|uniref:hypothetical protein n=1 Tax=Paenibacillus thiaminolyticus TaxID=49283 RepID=UPI00232B09D4|nr:hypothetical protein [Paenibacillus thiaminolyticus]WCF07213.1 hypothetical protein NDS46_23200 [Paenibacillus thiaminolyticus]
MKNEEEQDGTAAIAEAGTTGRCDECGVEDGRGTSGGRGGGSCICQAVEKVQGNFRHFIFYVADLVSEKKKPI